RRAAQASGPSGASRALYRRDRGDPPARGPPPGASWGAPVTRSGLGFDRRPLVEGPPLVLGGVTVESDLGLSGHSDADVLSHAVGEALLGALALGDLGRHFPDTDSRYRGISSLALLRHVVTLVVARGGAIVNVDATAL